MPSAAQYATKAKIDALADSIAAIFTRQVAKMRAGGLSAVKSTDPDEIAWGPLMNQLTALGGANAWNLVYAKMTPTDAALMRAVKEGVAGHAQDLLFGQGQSMQQAANVAETALEGKAFAAMGAKVTADMQALAVSSQAKWAAQQAAVEAEAESSGFNFYLDFVQAAVAVGQIIPSLMLAVVALIPGVGVAIALAVSAAISIAKGEPLTDAVIDSLANLVPGGQLGKMIFHIAVDVAQGRDAGTTFVDALGLPPEVKAEVKSLTSSTAALARGDAVSDVLASSAFQNLPSVNQAAANVAAQLGAKNLSDELTKQLVNALPPDVRQALTNAYAQGFATGGAKMIQDAGARAFSDPTFVAEVIDKGRAYINESEVLRKGLDVTPKEATQGFLMASGLAGYEKTASDLIAARATLPPNDQIGFDMAVALITGKIATDREVPAPVAIKNPGDAPKYRTAGKAFADTPVAAPAKPVYTMMPMKGGVSGPLAAAAAGYLITRGMVNATEDQRVSIASALVQNPDAKAGAAKALSLLAPTPISPIDTALTWIGKLFAFFGL